MGDVGEDGAHVVPGVRGAVAAVGDPLALVGALVGADGDAVAALLAEGVEEVVHLHAALPGRLGRLQVRQVGRADLVAWVGRDVRLERGHARRRVCVVDVGAVLELALELAHRVRLAQLARVAHVGWQLHLAARHALAQRRLGARARVERRPARMRER